MQFNVKSFVKNFGLLRLFLFATSIVCIVFAPTPGTKVSYQGWDIVPTLLLPTLAPLIFLIILLDMLMTRVFMVDAQNHSRSRYKQVFTTEAIFALIMLIFWVPFFRAIV